MLNVFRVAGDFGWSQEYWVLARNCRTIFQPLSSFFLLTMITSAHLDSWLLKEFKKLSFMVHYHFAIFELQKYELVIWLTEVSNLMHDFLTCGAHFLIHKGGNGHKDPTICTALTRVFCLLFTNSAYLEIWRGSCGHANQLRKLKLDAKLNALDCGLSFHWCYLDWRSVHGVDLNS
jgi:hypothetical protein